MDLLVGHVFVWGWMLGMLRALMHHDGPLARALWESALTVTLHMRVALTDANKAAMSISESELRKSAAGILTDSFVGFAAKCAVIFEADPKATNKAKLLAAHNVKYAGAEPTKSMLTVILYFRERFDARAVELMEHIEFKFGRDVLTKSYSKLARLGMEAATHTPDGMLASQVVCSYLEYLKFALSYEVTQPTDVTAERLGKQKDGTPGDVATVFGRTQVVALVRAWVEDLRTPTQTSGLFAELSQIMPMFDSYFPVSSTASPPDGGDADGEAALAEPQATGSDAVDEAKKKFKTWHRMPRSISCMTC